MYVVSLWTLSGIAHERYHKININTVLVRNNSITKQTVKFFLSLLTSRDKRAEKKRTCTRGRAPFGGRWPSMWLAQTRGPASFDYAGCHARRIPFECVDTYQTKQTKQTKDLTSISENEKKFPKKIISCRFDYWQ
jgi:hypothetical protein